MTVNEKIKALRDRMSRHNIDIYIVPTCDFHGSEYVGDYFKTREFISGFTGSAGTVVVTLKEAALEKMKLSYGLMEDIFFRQKASLRTQRLSL